ncbi:flagellar hook-basal body protein [Sulfobacillus harzensis]|uniref:Flagellar hook-basal body complex protein n=1 Tax=Sulfobacillus harzensis TaxID=2729629 RepID=A0A7Y0Q4B5_9FIRM|nr:flagellar hook-basal body complex protein [Sulfobacillus harzensis]NMP23074.1 flagellar hook-basal body complex protein [Sulfobacillus harzensis]
MFSVLGIGSNGLNTQSDVLNAIASNIANANTPGYGSRETAVASTGNAVVRPSGAKLLGQTLVPGLTLNAGAALQGNVPVFGTGIQPTSTPSNLAIQGDGFFMVSTPNGIAFTRAGTFEIDSGGELVLPSGAKLYPPVTIPQGAQFTISADGVVTIKGANGPQVVGQVKLASIPNPSGLVAQGNNLYGLSANSGKPTVVTPGQGGTGTLAPSAVNQSSTNLADNLVNLVQAETAYSVNAKVISVDQQVIQSTTNLQV